MFLGCIYWILSTGSYATMFLKLSVTYGKTSFTKISIKNVWMFVRVVFMDRYTWIERLKASVCRNVYNIRFCIKCKKLLDLIVYHFHHCCNYKEPFQSFTCCRICRNTVEHLLGNTQVFLTLFSVWVIHYGNGTLWCAVSGFMTHSR